MGSKTLLDLGNVIVKVDFQPFFRWLSTKGKYSQADEYEFFVKSSLFYDFEFGQISPKEFYQRASLMMGLSTTQSEFEERFCGIFPGYVDGIEDFIQNRQEPLYCLSNTNEIHLHYIRERFPLVSEIQTLFSSFDMQKRKPYPGIYREVADRLEVAPENVIFFDDVASNVEGAKKAGLEAHLFQDVASMRTAIEEFQKSGR